MAIDRIGKGGPLPPSPETPAAGDVGSASPKGAAPRPFTVDRPVAANATGVDAVGAADGPSALARLRAGEVDVHGYVDLKVEEATKALPGLSPAEVDEIRNVLRDQLRTDPGLADLVRTATGKMPTPPED